MSEQSFIEKATEISIRYANYSSEIKAEFNNRVREMNTENLITPKWLSPENRSKAIEITNKLESLVNDLLESYKNHTLLMFRELTEIDEDISLERRTEILEKFLKKLNESSFQVGGFFALSKGQFTLAKELFHFFEQRNKYIFFENEEILFELDEDIGLFNEKIAQMTEVHSQLLNLAEINDANIKKLAESVGIVFHR